MLRTLLSVGAVVAAFSTSQTFAQNRLFLTVNEFNGSTTDDSFVGEVDLTSPTFDFNRIFDVPRPPNGDFIIDRPRDLIADEQGNIQVYNGTFAVSLLNRDVSDGSITQALIPGLSTENFTNFGGIARQGNVVFFSDQFTLQGGQPRGIVRFDLDTNTVDRVATDINPRDINIGLDGTLLAAESNRIFRYDSITGELLNTIDPSPIEFQDIRGVAGLADGTILAASFGGDVFRIDELGNVLSNLTIDGRVVSENVFSSRLHDIDVAQDGQVAIGTADGDIILTTTALDSFEVVSISDQIPSTSGTIFVTFGADFDATLSVPERGDVNLDGLVNFLDIAPFISRLTEMENQPEADVNEDGIVNFLDISPFIGILTGPSSTQVSWSDSTGKPLERFATGGG